MTKEKSIKDIVLEKDRKRRSNFLNSMLDLFYLIWRSVYIYSSIIKAFIPVIIFKFFIEYYTMAYSKIILFILIAGIIGKLYLEFIGFYVTENGKIIQKRF